MNPLISIIIPVYNIERFLPRCLDSVISQTYSNLEIICIDDGSTDNSLNILNSYALNDERIKVISKANEGAGAARNAGLNIFKGEWAVFVDGDDWLPEDAVETLVSSAKEHKVKLAMGGVFRGSSVRNTHQKYNACSSSFETKMLDFDELMRLFFRIDNNSCIIANVWAKLIHRSVLEKCRFIEHHINEDIEFCYRLFCLAKDAIFVEKTVYNYFRNISGVTNSPVNNSKQDLFFIWEKVADCCKKEHPEHYEKALLNYKRAYFTILSKMYLDGYDKNDAAMRRFKAELKEKCRSYYKDVMTIKLSFSRKILFTLVCIL